jgi:hypothetical protein
MPILDIQTNNVGAEGFAPVKLTMNTSDSLSTVLTAGYLNKAVFQMGVILQPGNLIAVTTRDTPDAQPQSGIFNVQFLNGNWSLTPMQAPGDVILPTTANYIAIYNDDLGTLTEAAINEPIYTRGGIVAGENTPGSAGTLRLNNDGTESGAFLVEPLGNNNGAVLKMSNEGIFADQSVIIPNAGVPSCKFLLDEGPGNIKAMQQFVGLSFILDTIDVPTTTWVTVRDNAGDYSYERNPIPLADGQSLIGVDITPQIQTAVSKGFELVSYTVFYKVIGVNLLNLVADLQSVTYTNGNPVVVTFPAVTQTFPIAVQSALYGYTVTLNTPAYLNTPNSKHMIEVSPQVAQTGGFKYYGLMLNFNQTIA